MPHYGTFLLEDLFWFKCKFVITLNLWDYCIFLHLQRTHVHDNECNILTCILKHSHTDTICSVIFCLRFTDFEIGPVNANLSIFAATDESIGVEMASVHVIYDIGVSLLAQIRA